MSCQVYQDKMSAFCDGQLPDQEWLEMEGHLSKCPSCFEENSKLQQELFSLHALDDSFTQLKVPRDFSQNVMARVRVSSASETVSSGIWKRAGIFALVFVVYAIYVLSATSTQTPRGRELMIFNLIIASMGLGFIFFSNEMVGLNNKVLKRFSEQYNRIRSSDVLMSRMIGAAIFFGLLTHKLIFNAINQMGHIFN